MKRVGLIGGMSWESSAHYYAAINRGVRDALGAPHSADCVMLSLDFQPIAAMQAAGDWDALGDAMADAAVTLERAGADFILVCTNTMHCLAHRITAATDIPLLHIAEPLGAAIRAAGMKRVGLLGTRFTMEQPFYRDYLSEHFALEVVVPGDDDRTTVHNIIYDELVAGIVRDESRAAYTAVIERLVAEGAQGVILGCTEIMMLVGEADSPVPLFDTTILHAEAAVRRALEHADA